MGLRRIDAYAEAVAHQGAEETKQGQRIVLLAVGLLAVVGMCPIRSSQ
jgi:hypothetical protein